MSVLKLENVAYKYNGTKKYVLKNLNYEFEKGKIYSIVGPSGAGKTTLLSLLSGLSKPTDGNIYLEDKNINKIDRYEYRSNYVGVVFQSFNLLTHLTALENVILSMNISKGKFKNKKKVAMELLEKLSGGQQQRVAIARALSYNPNIILADEPTGNLDGDTQVEILKIFHTLANEGKCVILVTHSPDVARESDVVYELQKVKENTSTKNN